MTSPEFVSVPRRGTPNFRAWVLRVLAIGVLPVATVVVGLAAIRASDISSLGGAPFWADFTGFLLFLLVLLLVAGILALFDRRTRLAGVATIAIALFFNPVLATLVRWGLGLA